MLVVALLLLTACSKKQSSTLAVIPADSRMVVAMRMDQLSEKMNFNEVKSRTPLGFVGGLLSMQGIPNFIEDRTVTGIDFAENVYLFLAEEDQIAMAFQLEDESKMRDFLSAINKDRPVQDGNGFQYTDIGQVAIGWEAKTGLLVMGSDETDPVDILDRLFHLETDSSMAGSSSSAQMITGNRDISLLIDLSMLKEWSDAHAVQDLQGRLQLSVSFEEGQVVMASLLEGDAAQMAQISGLFSDRMDDKLLQVIPDTEAPAAVAMRFSNTKLQQVLQQAGIRDMMRDNMEISEQDDAQLDALLASFTGEMVVVLTDLDVTQEQSEAMEVQPHWYLAAGILDEAPLRSMMDTLLAEGVVTAENGYWANTNPELGILVLRDGMLLISTYPGYYDALIQGGKGTINSDLKRAADKYPLYVSVDLQKMGNMLSAAMEAAELSDAEDVVPTIQQLAALMDRLEINAMEPTDNGWEGKAVLTLTEKEENSLSVLTISLVGILMNSGMLPL